MNEKASANPKAAASTTARRVDRPLDPMRNAVEGPRDEAETRADEDVPRAGQPQHYAQQRQED